MVNTISVGNQKFDSIIQNHYFYVDKTGFIKDWFENGDTVTLITRPRRFGKTLCMSMMKCFFSLEYKEKKQLFDRLEIHKHPEMMTLQGTYPVISISFADVKGNTYRKFLIGISKVIRSLYREFQFLCNEEAVSKENKEYILNIVKERKTENGEDKPLPETTIIYSLSRLCEILYQFYEERPLVFLDEYDTPLQEAYVSGYWKQSVSLVRSLFNSTFKTNDYLERAILTGITRVAKESIFSDLNNLEIASVTDGKYAEVFGFTEREVTAALKEYNLSENINEVRKWYDGFTFGKTKHIFNPWSITNYLEKKEYKPYWANTSSNSLVSKLVSQGDNDLKQDMEALLKNETIRSNLNEEIIFEQLEYDPDAVWSLLLASGYLKPDKNDEGGYSLSLTNYEVRKSFDDMVSGWFKKTRGQYNGFVKYLLEGNIKGMNQTMGKIALSMFSFFDPNAKGNDPEMFYHGFVLGLISTLQEKYYISSNRESGLGRYDIILEPLNNTDAAIIIEFKVFDKDKEKTLKDTVNRALNQIENKQYDRSLLDKGIIKERIRKYGFGFKGKEVLIGG